LGEIDEMKRKSWDREISLANGVFREDSVNWDVIFGERSDRTKPLHPMLPSNPTMANTIFRHYSALRDRLRGSIMYPRYSHKNMSRSTRRDYERVTGHMLNDVPIFGQDDWIRFYHSTGYMLIGDVEMRQRWYTAGVKPRTYFAMGGSTFQYSRFLQDFFSQLVDVIPSTNHKTRLRPGRLVLPVKDDLEVHWRIYDLSSFTSNCCVQRSFCYALAEFFLGVDVIVLDERSGYLHMDLGEMLFDYTEHCVVQPSLSLERYDDQYTSFHFHHWVASMLGIFGNLMSCTAAHFLITSPLVSSFDEINCAGDDEIIPEHLENEYEVDQAVRIVGMYERTKSFRGDEEGAIHLKRPFVETTPQPSLLLNLIPPNVATCILVLTEFEDPRFKRYGAALSVDDAISVVGKDLMRFLESAYRLKYDDTWRLHEVLVGFSNLVRKHTGYVPRPCLRSGPRDLPYWPIDPINYEFNGPYSPMEVLVSWNAPVDTMVPRRETVASDEMLYRIPETEFEANSSPRLKLLETLGYVEKEEVMVEIPRHNRLEFWMDHYKQSYQSRPVVYRYSILKEIPRVFFL
jgi:hypothetical protein